MTYRNFMMKLRTRQIVETSTHMTSTANMEINRRGINMLYPPVGQLAVAAAEAAVPVSSATLSASVLMVMTKVAQT